MQDLLDLDLSAPSTSAASTQQQPPGRSAFDYLARAGNSSYPPPLSATSSARPSPIPSRSASPYVPPQTHASPPTSSTTPSQRSNGSDAFASLFGGDSRSSSAAASSRLTMAERLARDSSAKLAGTPLHPPLKPSTSADPSWDFDLLAPLSSADSASSNPAATPVTSKRTPTPSVAAEPSTPDLFDFDPKANTSASFSRPSDPFSHMDDDFLPTLRTTSPGSQPLSARVDEDDDFDILGDLSKPVSLKPPIPTPAPAHRPSSPATAASSSQPSRVAAPSRSTSPPPHILGQLVEMGFDIPRARAALEATVAPDGKWNLEAALEALVDQNDVEQENIHASSSSSYRHHHDRVNSSPPPSSRPRRRHHDDFELGYDDDVDPVLGPRPESARHSANSRDPSAGVNQAKVQEHAAEIFAQASKIGFSVFKSANSYWETGRAHIQKALDETLNENRTNGSSTSSSSTPRPKWMTEQEDPEESTSTGASSRRQRAAATRDSARAGNGNKEVPPTLFHDSDNDDPVLAPNPSDSRKQVHAPVQSQKVEAAPQDASAYRSPWRRAKPITSTTSNSGASSASKPPPSSSVPEQPKPKPRPKPKPITRPSIPVTTEAVESSTTHKVNGNDLFKLGRYGDAEQLYTRAIDTLPEGTLALVPLFNNRANARLKNGDGKGAVEDCGRVVALVLGSTPGANNNLVIELLPTLDAEASSSSLPPEAKDLNLKEQLSKALGRRAQAHETSERWQLALDDWTTLFRGGDGFMKSAGGSKVVSDGLARCRKAVSATTSSTSDAPPPPKPKPKPTQPSGRTAGARPPPPAVQSSGEAVKALRSANEQQANEDELKFSLKDTVDARIGAWKNGKETNLRALIASLDTVLWPELGWNKVGLHELVTDAQVKVRYVRAIAKLHPDKLNVNNTTVEQRMIAGAVFASLNEAWNASR